MTRHDVADALRPLLDEDIELVLLTHGGRCPIGHASSSSALAPE